MKSRKSLGREPTGPTIPYLPTPSEAALLLLLIAKAKDEEAIKAKPSAKQITRFRVSEATLKRVFLRSRISPGFLDDVQEWLLTAGWALIFSRGTYALIRVAAVEGWARLSSKWITQELEAVKIGQFDFDGRRALLLQPVDNDEDDADGVDTDEE